MRDRSICSPAVRWMRKVWRFPRAFIIRFSATSPSTTAVSTARGSPGRLPECDRGIKRARFAVLRLTKVPAVLIEGGFLTESGESKLISNKDWRAKLAGAIGIGIENYQALPIKKQPPMIVADYRRETKSAPIEPAKQEGTVKEADASLLQLVGRSVLLSQPQPQPQPSTPAPTASL